MGSSTLSVKAEKTHHHFEIKPGLEAGATRSEEQNFPGEGEVGRWEEEVVSMEGEGSTALPPGGEETTPQQAQSGEVSGHFLMSEGCVA